MGESIYQENGYANREAYLEALSTALLRLGPELERKAKLFAATHSVPVWKALAVVLFQESKRGSRCAR